MNPTISPADLACDFRYALEVMEEANHLGLDDEHARLLHGILQRRINETCVAISVKPAALPRFQVNKKASPDRKDRVALFAGLSRTTKNPEQGFESRLARTSRLHSSPDQE
jgi:hypothetical protein